MNLKSYISYKTILSIILISCLTILALLESQIRKSNSSVDTQSDVIVVLGAKVRDSGPSLSLISRMDAAISASQYNPDAKIILSGGQGDDEPESEAQAMFDYMVDHGVNSDRLLLEDHSTTTLENLTYAKQLIAHSNKWLVITNDYHTYRACEFAKSLGMNAVCHGAPSPEHVALKLRLREYVAILYYFLFGE